MRNPNEASLRVGSDTVMGWTDIRVTRGIERFPSDFAIGVTEKFPGQPTSAIREGQECQLLLGEKTVITGYIDSVSIGIDAASHTFGIAGRSKCMDLLDCSAEFGVGFNGTILSASVKELASKLAAPYGITVRDLTQQANLIGETPPIALTHREFTANLGETPYEIIERVARSVGMLVYDDPEGNLVLASAEKGELPMASGIKEGVNVQSAHATFSVDQRYHEYKVFRTAIENQQDAEAAVREAATARQTQNSSDFVGNFDDPYAPFSVIDPAIRRARKLYIIGEQVQGNLNYTHMRARWERNRRAGRSNVVTVTVDSWHDAQGVLWQPNSLVRFQLPSLKLSDRTWLISEVTYSRNAQTGTTAELVLMPKEAFDVHLAPLTGYDDPALTEALRQAREAERQQLEQTANAAQRAPQ